MSAPSAIVRLAIDRTVVRFAPKRLTPSIVSSHHNVLRAGCDAEGNLRLERIPIDLRPTLRSWEREKLQCVQRHLVPRAAEGAATRRDDCSRSRPSRACKYAEPHGERATYGNRDSPA